MDIGAAPFVSLPSLTLPPPSTPLSSSSPADLVPPSLPTPSRRRTFRCRVALDPLSPAALDSALSQGPSSFWPSVPGGGRAAAAVGLLSDHITPTGRGARLVRLQSADHVPDVSSSLWLPSTRPTIRSFPSSNEFIINIDTYQ